MKNSLTGYEGMKKFMYGVAWYPEHWPETRWSVDLKMMKSLNMNVVRLGEFSWSTLEPEEGVFNFSWLDRAIKLADSMGFCCILGTPTAAPPAWLTQKYPNALRVDEKGQIVVHGNRCHFNPWNADYLRLAAGIAGQMARRYGKSRAVIGWQIDNEYSLFSYDAETRLAFQKWLKGRFGSLEALNKAWSGRYWSQEYSDWAQIPLPVGNHNPGLRLEFQRFHSFTFSNYQRNQLRAMKTHLEPWQKTTHNFMGWFSLFNHYEVAQELDVASLDQYWATGEPDFEMEASAYRLARGWKKRGFWLMETQPNSVNWAEINSMLEPGRSRLRVLQAVAHGAEASLFWQWRSAPGGQEQLHGTIVGQDGDFRPISSELATLGKDLESIAGLGLVEMEPQEVAILNSYDSRWALSFQQQHVDYGYVTHLREHLQALRVEVDIISEADSLEGRKLVIVPSLWLLSSDVARQLRKFVLRGGHLVLTTRTGVKDEKNRLVQMKPPGLLRDLAGAEVLDSYPLSAPAAVEGGALKCRGRSKVWADLLRPTQNDVEIWSVWGKGSGWLEGTPAVVSRCVKAGRVTTLCGWFDSEFLDQLMARVSKLAKLASPINLPKGVEVVFRRDWEGGQIAFVLNHSKNKLQVKMGPGKDAFTGHPVLHSFYVGAGDAKVIKMEKNKGGK